MKVYVLVFVENPANFTMAEHLILTLDNKFIRRLLPSPPTLFQLMSVIFGSSAWNYQQNNFSFNVLRSETKENENLGNGNLFACCARDFHSTACFHDHTLPILLMLFLCEYALLFVVIATNFPIKFRHSVKSIWVLQNLKCWTRWVTEVTQQLHREFLTIYTILCLRHQIQKMCIKKIVSHLPGQRQYMFIPCTSQCSRNSTMSKEIAMRTRKMFCHISHSTTPNTRRPTFQSRALTDPNSFLIRWATFVRSMSV